MRKLISCVLLFLCFVQLNAQSIDSLYTRTPSIDHKSRAEIDPDAHIYIAHFAAPAVLITYGALALHGNDLQTFNYTLRSDIQKAHPHGFKTSVDNYLQFSPAMAVIALQLAGIKGRNSPLHETIIYATSMAITTALVTPIKHWSHELRPDNSNYKSFPSGHTATTFASAEFLRIEYGQVSPWIAVGGYAAATATAVLRMHNNKHWFSDVIAGAGFGILSTDLAYLLNDRLFFRKKANKTLGFFPVYSDNSYGVGLVKVF